MRAGKNTKFLPFLKSAQFIEAHRLPIFNFRYYFIGDYRVVIKFNQDLPATLNLELVVFAEFSEVLSISHKGKISKSHS